MLASTGKRAPRGSAASKHIQPLLLWMGLVLLGGAESPVRGQVLLNEVLFNPPGSDLPNEYIELRGPPNYVLPQGAYLVTIQGDAENNPGTIENVFDLSDRALGGNGFLVLLQKTNSYSPNPAATVLVNTNGAGWGSGSSSAVGHRGNRGRTDLANPSVTFFLIQSPIPPVPGADIDTNNTGVVGGPAAGWQIWDSVGVLDNSGTNDFACGAINYRRNGPPGEGAGATGVIVPVDFTPSYVGRAGNTAASGAFDWVATGNLKGGAPNWSLDDMADTMPGNFANKPLNHIGGPNFGAPPLDGVLAIQPAGPALLEGSAATASYALALNTQPAGVVYLEAAAPGQLRLSTDNGATFGASRILALSDTNQQKILVRALADNVVDASPHWAPIVHRIISTSDPVHYPVGALTPTVFVPVLEKDALLLNEVKVNPPGADDGPCEFVEVLGQPGAWLTNVYLVAVDGRAAGDPGEAQWVADLSGASLGSLGLLVVLADGHPYSIPTGASVLLDAALSDPHGALGNGALSLFLLSSPQPIRPGADLDKGDNGTLEGWPEGTSILDAIGWRAATNDFVYGGVSLTDGPWTPDAAVRLPANNTPRSAPAWFYGALAGTDGTSLVFDTNRLSPNFPPGFSLTPGEANHSAPVLRGLGPLAGAIGDPTNPRASFAVSDLVLGPRALTFWLTSSNPAVVPEANITLDVRPDGLCALALDPVGIGHSWITVYVSNGADVGQSSFWYAASERGSPDTRYYVGASDASTAIAPDATYIWVGDDENQILRLYRRDQSGPPLAQLNFTDFLALPDLEQGLPREVDVEASTRVGNRIFWMGSHAHNYEAELRTNRSRVFATDLSGAGADSTLTYAGRYDFLKLDLINWDQNNGHGKGANYYGLAASAAAGVNSKTPEGFNLEGLSMAPGSATAAYIGMRAPIVPPANRAYALIVPVLNFAALAASTGPPGSAVFGNPIELDLYGRGIRSLEGQGTNFLIVAGPPGDSFTRGLHKFQLYTWTGNPADPPQLRAADLGGLNPEGIVELPPAPWTADTQVQLLSDCGTKDWYGDGTQAKHLAELAFKKFRSDWVAFGPVVQPAPVVTSIQYTNSAVRLEWRALKSLRYRVQYKATLSQLAWTDLPGDVLAAGPYASKADADALGGQRFYQVVIAP